MGLDIQLNLRLTVPEQTRGIAAWQTADPLEEVALALARSLESISHYLPLGAKLHPPEGETWAQVVESALACARSGSPEMPSKHAGFEVVLERCGNRKISIIKTVRMITGMGLADTKRLVESAPVTIATGIDRPQAETIAAQLMDAGGQAKIR
jgi:large subunit ribosomal protein L7/L12